MTPMILWGMMAAVPTRYPQSLRHRLALIAAAGLALRLGYIALTPHLRK